MLHVERQLTIFFKFVTISIQLKMLIILLINKQWLFVDTRSISLTVTFPHSFAYILSANCLSQLLMLYLHYSALALDLILVKDEEDIQSILNWYNRYSGILRSSGENWENSRIVPLIISDHPPASSSYRTILIIFMLSSYKLYMDFQRRW